MGKKVCFLIYYMRTFLVCTSFIVLIASCKKETVSLYINNFTPKGDGYGAIVTITGHGFGLNAKVYFSGTQATIHFNSDSLLIVSVPQGAKSGKISVSTDMRIVMSLEDFEIFTSNWSTAAPYPGDAGVRSIAFDINGIGYIGGGHNGDFDAPDFYQYNPVSNIWTRKNDMPYPVDRAGSASLNNIGYVIAGHSTVINQLPKSVWSYDPVLNSWSRKADFPGLSKVGAVAVSLQNKIYFGVASSGGDLGKQENDWWAYDPAIDQWTQKANFPVQENNISETYAFVLNGFAYVGIYGNDKATSFYKYDPRSDQWSKSAELVPIDYLGGAVAFSLNGKGVIAGGDANYVYVYDPVTDSWSRTTSLPKQVSLGAVFSIDNHAYCGTGLDSGYHVQAIYMFSYQ